MPRTFVDEPSFEQIVDSHYQGLYRFALSLAQDASRASDLTQQTFYLWATKGQQLRDRSKVKTWLFTTLHREFLGMRRRENRFRHFEMSEVDHELPTVSPGVVDALDAATVMEALMDVEELYRAPLCLFYQEDHSYEEIARVLNIPIGTVMSRLARGKEHLRQILAVKLQARDKNVIPMPSSAPAAPNRHG